jgi:hypothetical protein
MARAGKVDVIGHWIGATLAARQVHRYGLSSKLHAFVGIASAFHGLHFCGTYLHDVAPICGRCGLSTSSPLLDALYGKRFGSRVYYSSASHADPVVCCDGVRTVGHMHKA